MATYITLVTYTQKGIENIKESPKRLAAVKEVFQGYGGKLLGFYLVMGRYDVVLVSEAPNDETVAKVALAVGSKGAVKTETFRAFNESEFLDIVSSLP